MIDKDDWWTRYFDDVFLRIYRGLLTPQRTDREVDAIRELLSLRRGASVLDVGCGWGRHSVALASHGFNVTGVDLSAFLLGEAARNAADAGVQVTWHQGDMRALPFRRRFDATLSLFSSLGYFGTDEEDLRVLRGIRAALRPGGRLLLETMHRDLIAREFAHRDWWETPDGDRVWVEREFDPVAGISQDTLHWRAADGTEGRKRHTIRVRTATEWDVLLRRAELTPVDWFGSWDLEPLALESPRLIVLARAA